MMRGLWCFALCLATSWALPTSSGIVDVGYAKFQGKYNDSLGTTAYYSMRYAAPPIGDLRWRAPVPIEDSNTYSNDPVIDTSAPQFQCFQLVPTWRALVVQQIESRQIKSNLSAVAGLLDGSNAALPQSEDCLRLDVVVPEKPVSSKIPVAVYIHGGGYTQGSAISSDGNEFVSFSDGQIIYVAIQYRLGAFGFLSGNDVKADGTANAGLLDQRLALEWVQRHISAFGGDPDRVTIWGGSAGGGSVTSQMILYGGGSQKVPFSAAIPEYPWWQPFHDDDLLQAQYQSLLNASNCTDLRCLRTLESAALAGAATTATNADYTANRFGYGDFWYGPSVDGDIIRDLPSREFAAGHFSSVPVLINCDTYEGAVFTNFSLSTESEVQQSLLQLWPNVAEANAEQQSSFFANLYKFYPLNDFSGTYFNDSIFSFYFNLLPTTTNNSAYWQRQGIFGDYIINCPTYYVTKALTGVKQTIYKMIVAAGTQLHAADSLYLLGASNATDNPTLADTFKDYFIGFITRQDPNASQNVKKPFWPKYSTSNCRANTKQVLRMEDTAIYTGRDPDATERCDFFQSQSSLVRN